MDPKASAIAGLYISYDIPALYMLGLLDIDRNFLASFDKTNISMYCQFMSPFIHAFFCQVFIIRF
jgi:hypothetical protein